MYNRYSTGIPTGILVGRNIIDGIGEARRGGMRPWLLRSEKQPTGHARLTCVLTCDYTEIPICTITPTTADNIMLK